MSGNTYITKAFRLNSALQFVESLSEPANTMYYIFAGRHIPWPTTTNPVVNDNNPPRVDESTNGLVTDIYDNMVYAKNISPDDVAITVKRINYTSNTVYAAYDSNVTNLYDTQFYVAYKDGGVYKVYKCLGNNNGNPSTVPPTSTSPTGSYKTSDGYLWKWMYSVTDAEWDKFATSAYMPVVVNPTVTSSAINGSIDSIKLISGGANYNSYTSGTIQNIAGTTVLLGSVQTGSYIVDFSSSGSSNNNFYIGCSMYITSGIAAGQTRTIVQYTSLGSEKTVIVAPPFDPQPAPGDQYEIEPNVIVQGDGSGATARAIVNKNSPSKPISYVEIVDGGSGYTWATASVFGNTGIVGAFSPTSANIIPMISPTGGHGSNPYLELGATSATISVDINPALSENKILQQNDVRTFGIAQDFQIANVTLTFTTSTNQFIVGEIITQNLTLATGKVTSSATNEVTLTNVKGYFNTGNTITGSSSLASANVGGVIGPRLYLDTTLKLIAQVPAGGSLQLDDIIQQNPDTGGATARLFSVRALENPDEYELRVTNVRGTFNKYDVATGTDGNFTAVTSGINGTIIDLVGGDIIRPSGTVLFVDNITPITKTTGQIETAKFTLEF